jgi:hypothetical protein
MVFHPNDIRHNVLRHSDLLPHNIWHDVWLNIFRYDD